MQKGNKTRAIMSDTLLALKTRQDILDAAKAAGKTGAHIAPSLSLVEILLGIFSVYDQNKDVFILSKGHGALGYYAVMHQMQMITHEQFASFEQNGGEFPGQPSKSVYNHIEYSSGSLGMGLSYGVGRAWKNKASKVYTVMGDGEVNEGSVWEAAALAAQLHLNNVITVIDQNGLQSDGQCQDIINLNLKNIWEAYGWNVKICDGHSVSQIKETLIDTHNEKPTVILAKTIKGKGVSFMENNNEWHHHELDEAHHKSAVAEIRKYGFSEK